MSELISGKEAKLSWANGSELQWRDDQFTKWSDLSDEFKLRIFNEAEFRIKPRTITINGVEIEIPQDIVIDPITGSVGLVFNDLEKAKQGLDALRSIFNVK